MKKLLLSSSFFLVGDYLKKTLPAAPKTLTVVFVPTAADESTNPWYVKQDRQKLEILGFKIIDLSLKDQTPDGVKKILAQADIIFVAGGDYLNLFPIAGFISDEAYRLNFFQKIGNVAWHLVLPVVCLTYGSFSFLARFSRATMLEVIHQDYIRTARAKGLSEWKVIVKHGFRNALIPQLTLLGTLLPALLGGSVIIEQIFAIPGMGRLGFEAVLNRDYPLIMAIATIDAFLTLISLLISDLLYVAVDPRITFE